MSNVKESIKKKEKTLLSSQIKKELNLLPKIVKEKKNEIEVTKNSISSLKEKYNSFYKELEKISLNITSLEKDFTLLLIKNDNIKSHQKIILNSINNEMPFNFNNNIFKNEKKLREFLLTFLNFKNDFSNQFPLVLSDNVEITSLLIGAYSYLKLVQNDMPKIYQEIKNKIDKELDEMKELNTSKNFSLDLILNYIENIFKLLDNREKTVIFEKKNELLNQKKNEIFIKMKLIEEQKKEKELNLKIINNYISEIVHIIDQYKILIRHSKTSRLASNKRNNLNSNINNNDIQKKRNGINSGNNLNISCPNNHCLKNDYKINSKNKIRHTNDKINCINIDLTDTFMDKEEKNKKTIESIDDINSKINSNYTISEKINLSNCNIYDLEKDICQNLEELKTHPLYSIKISNNNNNISSKNKIIKKKINYNINRNENFRKRTSSNKSNNMNITEKNRNNELHLNSHIIMNHNEMSSKNNINADSKERKSINHFTSVNLIKNNSSNDNKQKKMTKNQINKPGQMKIIPYLTQDSKTNFKDTQNKINEPNIKREASYNESKNILSIRSPLSSSKNKTSTNNANTKNTTPFSNSENFNYNNENRVEKINQSSFAKISHKNKYISIKHNKTNIYEDDINNNEKKKRKSLNKIKVNVSKRELKKVNNDKLKTQIKNSPEKQSSSVLLKILKNDENNESRLKTKYISKVNLDIKNTKNRSPGLKQKTPLEKTESNNLIEEIKNEITKNELFNKKMNNSINNNVSKNCQIIPFKKNKTNRNNLSRENQKINKNDKLSKNNAEKEKVNSIIDININSSSQFINNIRRKEITNYSFNK